MSIRSYWHTISNSGNWYYDLPEVGWICVSPRNSNGNKNPNGGYIAYSCVDPDTNILPGHITDLEEAKAVALMIAKMS